MTEYRSIETSGETVEEAIESGLRILKVARESVIVEVLEDPDEEGFTSEDGLAVVRLTTAARPRPPMSSSSERRNNRQPRRTQPPFFGKQVPPERVPDDLKLARERLSKILDLLAVDAMVEVEYAPYSEEDDYEPMILQIHGDDVGLLLSRQGDPLSSLQHLVRLMVSRELDQRVEFVVDAGGYKSRRTNKLYQMAHQLADEAVYRRRTMYLEPMPPHERRVIHMALREREDVETESIGEGRARKVTIIPKRQPNQR